MKIAMENEVVYQYASRSPAAGGGAERYQWLLARALAQRGWSVIVGVRSELEPAQRVVLDGVEFVGMQRGQYFGAWYSLLAAERPDWCFWFGSTHLLGPAVAIARLTGARSLFSAQFDLDARPREALSARPRCWRLYAWGLSWSDRIFVQHRGQYAELPARWRKKTHVIPGIVQVPAGSVAHAARDAYVAWVGMLRQPKRPDLLIDIARRCPSVRFVVCGGASAHRSPPGYSARLIAELASVPNIDYLGHVAPDRAIDIIGRAALLLSTSEAEGFPSVFLEAWAHGTPVVSLTIDPDHVIARHGLGVKCDGVESASRDIEALLGSVSRREAIAARAREYAANTHGSHAVAALVEQSMRAESAPALQPFESVARS
jgi:glycosyltransferase involved in cell wall biosynthesis